MTRDFFDGQMLRLVGLRFMPSDLTTHWEALRDLPETALEAAVTRAGRSRSEFPAPLELRQDADQSRHHGALVRPDEDRSVELPEPIALGTLPTGTPLPLVTRLWRYYCDVCGDIGVQELWCGKGRPSEPQRPEDPPLRMPWLQEQRCGSDNCRKLGEQYGHSWVRPCACLENNPAVARRRERDAKYAAQPAARGAA